MENASLQAAAIFVGMEVQVVILSIESSVQATLAAHAAQVPDLQVLACYNATRACVEAEPVADLLLLDLDGLDLQPDQIEALTEQFTRVIILSELPKHAVTAFDIGALDFLLKPVPLSRFRVAMQRAFAAQQTKTVLRAHEGLQQPGDGPRRDYFFVKSDYKVIKVTVSEIQYIEGLREYVRIHTDQGRIVTLATLGRLEEILPAEHFARVHRSFIVNLEKIHFVQGNVISIGTKQVAISKSRREEFLSILNRDGLF